MTQALYAHMNYKKITRAKWFGSVPEVVELLLCKLEALSSNPSCTKKKKICEKELEPFVVVVFCNTDNGLNTGFHTR
jgi:hypothetical protein